jgi:serine/threonine protein kinase
MALDTHRVESLFQAAAQVPDLNSRAALLDRECGSDAELRHHVEALLRARGTQENSAGPTPETNDDLPRGRRVEPTKPPRPNDSLGSHIGPYKLLQLLGEGGMGAVYLAEQEEPVQRRVALKIIKAGLDSERVIARFEAERQALAMMDHPNIAKVLDGGTIGSQPGSVGSGRPYFVMELVKGIPITKYCDQEHLTPRERLELFIPVCQAVQHAHQKGIIHRDLKPSNVLIALYDGKPTPKVIDFGVAKATAQKLTERTMFTEVGQIVGTLEYMAPEQAELNNLDIDTRADIYSLGVLLYELLTGTTPFTAKQLRTAAFDEMLRIIREVEPPRPSTKLSRSDELPAIAANRKLEPTRLARIIRGDLDWIVMKCLEKERSRRYETANGLAMELQRYLTDEPVLAGPPRASYRLQKFLRRNRHGVIAAGLLLIALLVGLAGTTWGLVEARRQRDRAQSAESEALEQSVEARRQRDRALIAESEALEQSVEARTQRDRALKAEADALEQGGKAKASFALARDTVEEFCSNVANDPRLKEKDLEELRKELLQSAVKFHQTFVQQHRGEPTLKADLARALYDMSTFASDADTPARAIEVCKQAISAYEELLAEHPDDENIRVRLAQCLDFLGSNLEDSTQVAEARKAFNQSLDILIGPNRKRVESQEGRRAVARACGHLCFTLRFKGGEHKEAVDVCRRCLSYLEEGKANDTPPVRINVAGIYGSLAELLAETGDKEEARRWCEKAVREVDGLNSKGDLPARLEYSRLVVYTSVGRAYSDIHDVPKAIETFQMEVDHIQKLTAAHPGIRMYQDALGREYNSLAKSQDQAGKFGKALASYKKSLTIKEDLAVRYPEIPDYKANLARTLGNLALHAADIKEAREYQRRGETLMKELVVRYPKIDQYDSALGQCHYVRSLLNVRTNQLTEALEAADEAVKVEEQLIQRSDVPAHRIVLAQFLAMKTEICHLAGKFDSAVAAYRKMNDLGVKEAGPFYQVGTALMNGGKLDEAVEALRMASVLKPDYAEAHCNLGHSLVRQGKYKEGRDCLQRGHEIGTKQSVWRYPSEIWVKNVDAMIRMDARLPAILEGKDQPANAGERLTLAMMCQQHKHLNVAAVRFFTDAFAEQPAVAGDVSNQHRYNAACAAALAACGQGEDASGLDSAKCAELRKQALEWLRADLAVWQKLCEETKQRPRVMLSLTHWLQDIDFSRLRGEEALAGLAAEESTAWRKLWSDVADVLAKLR